jgi:hypothetical protein
MFSNKEVGDYFTHALLLCQPDVEAQIFLFATSFLENFRNFSQTAFAKTENTQ